MTGRMKARLIMKSRIPRYVCHRQWRADSCANKLQVRVEEMNEAVLSAVEEHALTPEDIEQVIQLTERDEVRDQKEALEREKKDIARRLEHLTEAIETGGDAPTLVAKIRKLEARCPAIDREIKDLQPVPRFAPVVLENRLAEWRRLLRQSTIQGRAVLKRVIPGRTTFTPRKDGYDFSAPTWFDRLFTGIVAPRPAFVQNGDVQGTEQLTPEDTFDGDDGSLLERAQQVKRGKARLWAVR